MDEVDFRVLAHVLDDPWCSGEGLGRRVGLSGTSARARLAALSSRGIFRGFAGLPAASAIGRVANGYLFPGPRDLERLDDVMAMDPVVRATLYDDGALDVLAYELPGAQGVRRDLESLLGAAPATAARVQFAWSRPAGAPLLGPLDLRMVRALLDEPRVGASPLAARTGLSPRTAQARRRALVEDGVLHVVPLLDEAAAGGGVLFHAIVFAESARVVGVAQKVLGDAVPIARLDEPHGAVLLGFARTAAHLARCDALLHALPDVSRHRLAAPRAHGYARERVAAWVDEAAARWRKASRAA